MFERMRWGFLFVVFFSLSGCFLFQFDYDQYDLNFVVEGNTSSVNVTVGSRDWTTQYSQQSVPFSAISEGWEEGSWFYLSGQNRSSSGSVTVRVQYRKSGDTTWKDYTESTSLGGFSIATVSGDFNP